MITALVTKQHSASEILGKIKKRRQLDKLEPPEIWATRRPMVGATHLRVRTEKRGRSRKLSPAQTQRLFKRHTGLASQADGECYMTVEEALRHHRDTGNGTTTRAA